MRPRVRLHDAQWELVVDDPFDPSAWVRRCLLLLPEYAGPTLIDYRPQIPLSRQYPRPWPPVRSGHHAWLRWAVGQMIVDPQLRLVEARYGVTVGGKQPEWVRAFHRDVIAARDRRLQLLTTDPAAREYAARYGTSTLTDVEHWHAIQLVDAVVADLERKRYLLDELWQPATQ